MAVASSSKQGGRLTQVMIPAAHADTEVRKQSSWLGARSLQLTLMQEWLLCKHDAIFQANRAVWSMANTQRGLSNRQEDGLHAAAVGQQQCG